jgi:pSer/pThr/pTyr-binding forkhead associated (FHA) protein
MIKSNPEIAVRMLRKYSLRLRETTKQIEQMASAVSAGDVPKVAAGPAPKAVSTAATLQTEAVAYFISIATGNVFPVFKTDSLLGRYDSVTGMTPEIDLSNEDQSRNISRRHARLVIKEGNFYIAEEIGTMNGTFLNGQKLPNGVLTPIKDGDELVLCRLGITFKTPSGK